jgi:hypothetical protein
VPLGVPLRGCRALLQDALSLPLRLIIPQRSRDAHALKGRYTNSLDLLAVAVLALPFLSGLYLFVLPYATKWRSARRTG